LVGQYTSRDCYKVKLSSESFIIWKIYDISAAGDSAREAKLAAAETCSLDIIIITRA
jgi:hypothetical protein